MRLRTTLRCSGQEVTQFLLPLSTGEDKRHRGRLLLVAPAEGHTPCGRKLLDPEDAMHHLRGRVTSSTCAGGSGPTP